MSDHDIDLELENDPAVRAALAQLAAIKERARESKRREAEERSRREAEEKLREDRQKEVEAAKKRKEEREEEAVRQNRKLVEEWRRADREAVGATSDLEAKKRAAEERAKQARVGFVLVFAC